MEVLLRNEDNLPLFVTKSKKKMMERDKKVYEEYCKYMSVEGQSRCCVMDYIAKRNNISQSAVYTIVKRMKNKKNGN